MHYLLFYTVAPDYLERRGQFRDAHLTKAWASHGRGELVLGGALADPLDTALLLFKADSADIVEEFARTDPYVLNGLVTSWRVRPWTTVAGSAATTPVHAAS
ncbi:MAG TPA: YciI-like protein [Gemmatimonadaceae bacterium]|jgi:hypothetical protein